MTSRARVRPDFQHALLPYVVAKTRNEGRKSAVAGDRPARLVRRRLRRRRGAERGVRFKHQLARPNPVLFRMQLGRIENDLRILLLQRFEIPRRLTALGVRRIPREDNLPHLQRVIHRRTQVARGTVALSQRDFHGFDGSVVPDAWNDRMKGRVAGGECGHGKQGDNNGAGSSFHVGSR